MSKSSTEVKKVEISAELAKDIYVLLCDAKHPEHQNKIIEAVKNQIISAINLSTLTNEKEV